MDNNNSIVFLHLSDIHLNNEKDISDKHIDKIVNSLNSYKTIKFEYVIIIISGDITQSGERVQFNNAMKLMGSLIVKLNHAFNCRCKILIVPGNHDVNHNEYPLDLMYLKDERYSEVEASEHKKLESFYVFSKYNHCFENSELYCDFKTIDIKGFKIQANLINNAIFSTIDQYKGLLYIPDDMVSMLAKKSNADFIISIMHHAPDFYRDEIKNKIEDTVIKNSNILFHGHEHYNYSKYTSFNGSNGTIVQSGGCLCHNGNWNKSSYIVGILNLNTLDYNYHKYTWNEQSVQYEHDDIISERIKQTKAGLKITNEFLEFINSDNNESYYVFPSIIYHGNKRTEDYQIEVFDNFKEELLNHHYSLIVGSSNIGKTTLLKHIFLSFAENYYVLYGSPEKLLEKSKNKRQNIKKLIESLFMDVYGTDKSKWQAFEQAERKNCIFILDDFEQIDGINLNDFFHSLSNIFGTIIISNIHTIDFNPYNINIEDKATIAKFEIKAPVGHKRREIIRAVVKEKADDKSEKNIENIVHQVDLVIKTQLSLIPPEPYYIIQMAENFMNNVGEAIYKSTNVFSKVFEANLTNKIDNSLKIKNKNKNITVDLMYVIFGKIAYFIHFNKAYPIKRSEIDKIIKEYNIEYGNLLETEDIISIAKSAKIITDTEESRESFRFSNKSILAYFVAKEIIFRKDLNALYEVINKACINICTDILLFIIYLTDETTILNQILSFIQDVIKSDSSWSEFSIPNAVPLFIKNSNQLYIDKKPVNKKDEKIQIEKSEEKAEELMITEFKIKDIYDWDDSIIDSFNNRLFRMTSLLQIISKCLPCFEHRLKKSEKSELIECLYTLPNRVFMFWCNLIDNDYEDIIEELKTHPYFTKKKPNMRASDIDQKVKTSFALYSINLLLNLYYIPVLNATGKNTFQFLNNKEFFDYSKTITYQLEHLMFLEQNQDSNDFVATALDLKKESDEMISSYMLQCIVRHGLITRNDTKENIYRLESKFFPKIKKSFLIERTKDKYSKK